MRKPLVTALVLLLGLAFAHRAFADIHPPTSLSATAQGSSSIRLAWSIGLQGTGETIHAPAAQRVYRDQQLIATIAGNAASYSDTGLVPSTTHSYHIIGIDDAGAASAPSNIASGTTLPPCPGPCSIFAPDVGPDFEAGGDPMELELGVRFTADVTGTISAIKFYKASGDSASHTVTLWDSAGTVLATTVAAGADGFGTQTVAFATPVAIAAGQTYTASYHEHGGTYGFSAAYFTAPIDNAPLHAPANAGVFRYGLSAFPSQSFGGNNYWVDVVFAPGTASTVHPPTNLVAAAQSASTIRLTWIPATEGSGETQHPAAAQVIFRDNHQLATVSGTTATYTDGSLAAGSTHSYFVVGKDATGATSGPSNTATATTTAACSGACNLFAADAGPAFESVDPNQVELGVRFTSDVAGSITAIRFYKPSLDNQPHSVTLWSASGTLLATAASPAQNGFGMQTVALPSPVAIQPGQIYVASYHVSGGSFGYSPSYFTAQVDSGPLHAFAASSGGNGVYHYGASAFPSQTFNANNYWADVVFVPAP